MKPTSYAVTFAFILVVTIIWALRTSNEKSKQAVILEHLGLEGRHIEKIDEARGDYLHISKVAKNRAIDDSTTFDDLIDRAKEVFKNEKYLMGIDKDTLLSKLGAMDTLLSKLGVDANHDLIAFGKRVQKWCESVANDDIRTFSKPEEEQKFKELMDLKQNIIGLQTKYTSGRVSWIDTLLIGLSLFASMVGLTRNIYGSLKPEARIDHSGQ